MLIYNGQMPIDTLRIIQLDIERGYIFVEVKNAKILIESKIFKDWTSLNLKDYEIDHGLGVPKTISKRYVVTDNFIGFFSKREVDGFVRNFKYDIRDESPFKTII